MCKLTPSVLDAQQKLLKRIERAEEGVTNRDIARVAGVDATVVSKWTTKGEDGREVTRSALLKMADCWGWDVIFGDDAKATGWQVQRSVAVPAEPLPAAIGLGEEIAALTSATHRMEADGVREEHEVADLEARALRLMQRIAEYRAGLKPGPRAVAR